MDLYIDKTNLESFAANHKHYRYEDCLHLMQKQLNINFNFNKAEIIENEILLAWFKSFTHGVGNNSKQKFSEEKFPERPLKSNIHNCLSPAQLSSVYLLDDERIDLCINTGALLIGKPREEISTLSKLFLQQDDYCLDKKLRIGGAKFSCWNDLTRYSFPVSDIIIIDPYIASDNTMIDSNLIEFLKVLANESKCKLNIVLYTNHDQINNLYAELSAKVRTAIRSVTGISPNFTLIQFWSQRGINSHSEHDRTVFTNYNRIYSGDTFNYFLSNGNIVTRGRELHLSNFGKKENHDLALELLQDIQNNINRISSNSIEGDKKSNFLNFT